MRKYKSHTVNLPARVLDDTIDRLVWLSNRKRLTAQQGRDLKQLVTKLRSYRPKEGPSRLRSIAMSCFDIAKALKMMWELGVAAGVVKPRID